MTVLDQRGSALPSHAVLDADTTVVSVHKRRANEIILLFSKPLFPLIVRLEQVRGFVHAVTSGQ